MKPTVTTLLLATLLSCGGKVPDSNLPVDPLNSMAQPTDDARGGAPAAPMYPPTRRADVSEVLHGETIADPYRWLEDEKSPEVQAWMDTQDAHTRAELAKLPGREAYQKRLGELYYYDAISAPVHRGRYFYTRKHADKEKTIVYWRAGEQGEEQVLFDPNTWSSDGTKGLGGWWPSRDGKLVAYNVKENNADEAVLHVFDLDTGKDLSDVIEGTKYASVSWTPDRKGFYYTWVPPVGNDVSIADRPGFAEIRFHPIGGAVEQDAIIYPATRNPETFLNADLSRDGHWLLVSVQHGWNSTDVYFRDARKPQSKWIPLAVGIEATFDVVMWKDRFYINTNDGAPRYRAFKVDPTRPERKAWKEIVPQGEATLERVQVVGERLVLTYLRDAATQLELRDLDGKPLRKVELPGIGTSAGLVGNPDEDTAYFSFTSFTEPQQIFKTSIKSGKTEEWARVKLPLDSASMVTEQVFYPSKDGTKISMFIIRPKDAKKDGKNPTILYGYGGFNVNLTPGFSSARAFWIEQGGIYAIPNLRGGGEYGEQWHRAGMLLNKQNVFDDFIAAAEALVKEGWTSPEHLAIQGGSNGGLLVGAAMTQAPDHFRAVICAVPLLDMIRYHLFGSGKTWIPEYGSAEDPAEFKAIAAYSPYRRAVDAGPRAYPALLMDSADHDDRVDPMHARKFVAAIRHAQTADAPVLLRIERNAGHGGADLVKQVVERAADQYAFLMSLLK
ncbi:MAG: prolyl oligopeptidase family serine peptidase [Kofleriaceae bacterium]